MAVLSANSQTDVARLLEKCKRGDERAWSQLVERYSSLVYSIPSRMKLNSDDCADVFQATFLALSNGLDRIEHAVALPRWLAVTASREAIRLRRLTGKSRNESSFEDLSLEAVIEDEEHSADTMAVQSLEAEEVRNGVDQLPERCRQLLELLFLDDEPSYAEVSKRTGVPVGAIGPTRARCLEKLKKILTNKGFFSGEEYLSRSGEAPTR